MGEHLQVTHADSELFRGRSFLNHTAPVRNLLPAYTSRLGNVGVTAACPVRVGSWIAGTGRFRTLAPGDAEYPGWHYGSTVYCPDQQDHRPHDHAHFEICIIRKGVAAHLTSLGYEELHEGTVAVIAPGMVHAIYGLQNLHQTNLYYLTEWLSDDLMAHWREAGLVPMFLAAALFRRPQVELAMRFQLTDAELSAIDRELIDITQESSLPHPSLTLLKSALLKVLIRLSRSCARQSPVEIGLGFQEDVLLALEYIEGVISRAEPFTVSDLADHLGVCPKRFALVFCRSTGWSPMVYYQRRRVQHASIQLLDMNRSITSVAHDLGYCDSAHFSRVFKQHQGISPKAYRGSYAVRVT